MLAAAKSASTRVHAPAGPAASARVEIAICAPIPGARRAVDGVFPGAQNVGNIETRHRQERPDGRPRNASQRVRDPVTAADDDAVVAPCPSPRQAHEAGTGPG